MATFRQTLVRLRKSHSLTQQELANLTGLTRSRINNYEQGIREPDFETLELFADFFQVNMDELLKGLPPAPDITATERRLIEAWRQCTERERETIAFMLKDYGMEYTPSKQEAI